MPLRKYTPRVLRKPGNGSRGRKSKPFPEREQVAGLERYILQLEDGNFSGEWMRQLHLRKRKLPAADNSGSITSLIHDVYLGSEGAYIGFNPLFDTGFTPNGQGVVYTGMILVPRSPKNISLDGAPLKGVVGMNLLPYKRLGVTCLDLYAAKGARLAEGVITARLESKKGVTSRAITSAINFSYQDDAIVHKLFPDYSIYRERVISVLRMREKVRELGLEQHVGVLKR